MSTGILITIIICVALVLSAIIAGISNSRNKKHSPHGSDLLTRISNTLWQIPSLLWYPIQAIVEMIHGVSFRFNESVHDTFKTEDFINSRIQKLIRNSVSSVLHSHSNLLNSYSNRRVAKTLTALLQLISFITTYAGFTFFLGTVNPIAPLCMAIVVQGGCYYLLNYAASRKRTGMWKRHILLFVLIFTSTITSYIGIFDGVVQPVNIMKLQYESYAETVNSIINQETENTYKLNIDYNEIEKSLDFINRTYNEAKNKIETLSQQAEKIYTQKSIQNSYLDENGNVIITQSTVTDSDAVNEKASINAKVDDLKNNYNNIQNFFNTNNQASDIYNAFENITNNSESSSDNDKNIWNAYINALYDCYILYDKLYPNAEDNENEAKKYYKSMNIDEEIVTFEKRNALESLTLDAFDEEILKDSAETVENKIIQTSKNNSSSAFEIVLTSLDEGFDVLNRIIVSENSTEAHNIRNTINKKINDNYINLSNKISGTNKAKLNTALSKAIIENPQIMPFTMPFTNKNVIGESVFSLLVACIIDGLSLLIAFALINKQKSILYFEKVVDLRATREEMLEDCLMYICLNDIQNNPSSNIKTASRAEIQDCVAKKINDVMRDFMSNIHQIYLSDELNSFGYISEDDIKEFNDDERRLFYTLNNAALIHPCHGAEIIKIINADFDDYSNSEPQANQNLIKKYHAVFSEDKIFYIVSKNLHFWFCENFSELLQNSLFFNISENDLNTNLNL